MSDVLELAPDPLSVAVARRWCRSVLGQLGDGEVTEVNTLLASELVSNAVLHAGTPCSLHIDVDAERVRVEVHDDDDHLPLGAAHQDPLGQSGRGLLLVRELSSSYGALSNPAGGKLVWFEVSAPAVGVVSPCGVLDPA
jgi:anti-sigma regulatory factor (Ser/Thr protein kinase)